MAAGKPAAPGLAAEVGSGDRLRALRALRDRLARDLDSGAPGVAAQLASQLRATLAEIEAVERAGRRTAYLAAADDDVVDGLAVLRAARLAATGVPPPSRRRRPAGGGHA